VWTKVHPAVFVVTEPHFFEKAHFGLANQDSNGYKWVDV
jgi:hypothetical protein